MRALAALLDSRAALGALRRSLPPLAPRVVACRSPRDLQHALDTRLVEAVVLGVGAAEQVDLEGLSARYPNIPVVAYGALRSEHSGLLVAWQRLAFAGVLVEGVDDAVAGEVVVRNAVSTRRRQALHDAPRLLRLREPLQLRTWDFLVGAPGRSPPTASIARKLGLSREHLSRQFAAGGAPNLKRVADLLTVFAALQLLGNPAYGLQAVARLLGFATASHLQAVIRRITGLPAQAAHRLTERELLGRFLRGGARSRSR